MDCYFFGTFNPPHFGHIHLAEHIKKEFSFEKIIFVPAFAPPHKETLDFSHRFNMLKLCVKKDLGEVSDIESTLQTPSYSFQTVDKILKTTPKSKLWDGKVPFILGYDAFIGIEKWKNPDILKQNIKFVVLKRHSGIEEEDIFALKDRGFDFVLSKNEFLDISSNEIREIARENSIQEGTSSKQNRRDLSKFIDKKVEEYIYDNRLYK